MSLRAKTRKKDGKERRYWSVVESRRVASGRVVQRHVLYLGEINSSQELAWRRSIEVLEDGESAPRTYALFPEDRCEGLLPDESIVRLKLKSMQLHRPRQWGACWLALTLWQTLDLDVFWAERLPPSRKGTRWDLLGTDETLADPHVLYGNTNDSKTLRSFLQKIEHQYGKAQRIWCMDRIAKERSMRRRKLKWLWARLAQLQDMQLSRDALLMKLGSAQSKVAAAWRLVDVKVDKEGAGFTYRLNRQKLKQVRRLPLVLSVRHTWPTTQSPGTRTHRAQCAGEICRRADGRCAHPDHRRP
jgi:hypothetical protein